MKRTLMIGLLAVLTIWVVPVLAQTDTPGGEPAIQINPEIVEPNGTIEVIGTDFAPETMVSAFLGLPETGMRGEPLTSVEVDGNGAFLLSFTMPQTWPSGAPITERDLLVVIASDFQPLASAPFTYDVDEQNNICPSEGPGAEPTEEATAEPTSESITDTQDLIEALCAAGATVAHGDPLPEPQAPFLQASAQLLIVNGAEVQVYEYPDEAAAEEARAPISPNGSGIGPALIDWTAWPHFYSAGRIIVLYLGNDSNVIGTLESVLGPQFAGVVTPEATAEANSISWEAARQLILNGEVEMVFQAHSLEVWLTLEDGRRVVTTEPSIDEVFTVVEECGDPCAGIALATE
jgi:hypothetical protein